MDRYDQEKHHRKRDNHNFNQDIVAYNTVKVIAQAIKQLMTVAVGWRDRVLAVLIQADVAAPTGEASTAKNKLYSGLAL